MVNYTLVGTVDEYRRKVYGDIPLPPVSPQQFLGERPAWDIRAAYAELWDEYCGLISNQRLTNLSVPEIMKGWKPDLIINTIPAKALCDEPFRHSFTEQACYAMGDAPALGQRVPIPTEPFTVVCDGTKDAGYYRKANVFDHATVEWPGNRKRPPIEGVVGFSKPLSTNCDCWPEVHRAGRHGLWKKGILVHHVYSDVANRMKVLEGA